MWTLQRLGRLTLILMMGAVAALPALGEPRLVGWYELRPLPDGRAPFAVQGWVIADCGEMENATAETPEIVLRIDGDETWRSRPSFAWPGVVEKYPSFPGAASAGFWSEVDPARLTPGEHQLEIVLLACERQQILGRELFQAATPTPALWAVPVLLLGLGALGLLGWGLARLPQTSRTIPRLPAMIGALAAMLLLTVIAARHLGGSVVEIEGGFFAPLTNWDGRYYLGLAAAGYGGETDQYYAFFPLYPALLTGLSLLPGPAPLIAALANVGLFLTSIVLLRRLYPGQDPGVLFFALLPFAFFHLVVYTEALALVLALAFLHALRTGHHGRAALFGALAGLTRISAVALVFFALEPLRRKDGRGVAAALAPLLGLAAWMLYLAATTGDALAFLHVQEQFGRAVAFHPGRLLDQFLTAPGRGAFIWWEIFFLALVLVGAAALWVRRRRGEALFSAAVVLMPLFTLRLTSLNRYALAAFPVYLLVGSLLAGVARRRVFYAMVGLELLALFYYAARFGQQAWVG